MKKLIFSLAAIAALTVSAGRASAQAPAPAGPLPPGGPMYGPMTYGGPMYGGGGYYGGGHGHGFGGHGLGLGLFSGLFTNHGHKYDKRKNQGPQNVSTLPVATGGTLVFPQNPFIRSPRDFFMWDER